MDVTQKVDKGLISIRRIDDMTSIIIIILFVFEYDQLREQSK